jgi:DNA-binding MarR family transcriptional regulator
MDSDRVKLQREIARSLIGASRVCERALSPKKMTLPQFQILDLLSAVPNGLHQEVLVKAAETAQSAGVSALLKKMEYELGWICREIDRENRRRMIVKLQAKGYKIWLKAASEYDKELNQKLKKMTIEDLEQVNKSLDGLRKAFSGSSVSPS